MKTNLPWDKKQFAVEKKCDHKSGNRSGECATDGWHRVDGFDDQQSALTDAYTMGFDCYRVVDSHSGKVVTY